MWACCCAASADHGRSHEDSNEDVVDIHVADDIADDEINGVVV